MISLLTLSELIEYQKTHLYLTTGSKSLDEALTYPSGKRGWRTKTIVELYGKPGTGKTQICLTAANNCLKKWKRGVIYIDTNSNFQVDRFLQILRYHKVRGRSKFRFVHVDDYEDLNALLGHIETVIAEVDAGMIIIDSIGALITPLELQEKKFDYMNFQTFLYKKFKEIHDRHDLLILYTNELRNYFGPRGDIPMGDLTVSYINHIQVLLRKATWKEKDRLDRARRKGRQIFAAEIKNCGFIANNTGIIIPSEGGIIGPGDLVESTS